ncbi:MAG: hypothetical protein HEP70_09115 [Rhodobiaceae bacterium]|nr:hypothetical protein [Rhodobiaceae bacterium]
MFFKVSALVVMALVLISCGTPQERLASHVESQKPRVYGASGIIRDTLWHGDDLLDDGTYEIVGAGWTVNEQAYTIDMAFMHAVELGRKLGAERMSVVRHRLRMMCGSYGASGIPTAFIVVDFEKSGVPMKPGKIVSLAGLEAKLAPSFASPPPNDIETKQRIFLENQRSACPRDGDRSHPRFDELTDAAL